MSRIGIKAMGSEETELINPEPIQNGPQTIGQRLREARTGRHLTQDDLSNGLFSKSYISAVELGKIQPSIKALRILAKRLQISPSYFLGRTEMETENQQQLLELSRLRFMLEPLSGHHPSEVLERIGKIDRDELDEEQEAELNFLEARALSGTGQTEAALTKLKEVQAYWEGKDNLDNLARIYCELGEIYVSARKWLEVRQVLQSALAAVRAGQVYDPQLKLEIYSLFARVRGQIEADITLEDLKNESWALVQELVNPATLAIQYEKTAENYEAKGNLEKARAFFEYIGGVYNERRFRELAVNLFFEFGNFYTGAGRAEEAIESYRFCTLIARDGNLPDATALALNRLARLYLEKNLTEKALEAALEARKQIDPTRQIKEAGNIYVVLGQIYEKMGQVEEADNNILQGIEYSKKAGGGAQLADAYFIYGKIFVDRGDNMQAVHYMHLAVEAHQQKQ